MRHLLMDINSSSNLIWQGLSAVVVCLYQAHMLPCCRPPPSPLALTLLPCHLWQPVAVMTASLRGVRVKGSWAAAVL